MPFWQTMRMRVGTAILCTILGMGTAWAQAPAAPAIPTDEAAAQPDAACAGTGEKELLSDAQGLDLRFYLGQLHRIARANWEPLMPREVNPPVRKRGEVRILFRVLPSGHLKDGSLTVCESSGDPALDRAARGALETATFPPLPKEFKQPDLELCFDFRYNLDGPAAARKYTPKARGYKPLGVTMTYKTKL